jgi:ABC-type transport system substrate-binding protein
VPEVDKLLDDAAAALDRDSKMKMYDRVQEIFAEELPYFPTFQMVDMFAVRKTVHNFRPNPNRARVLSDFWNAYEWSKDR